MSQLEMKCPLNAESGIDALLDYSAGRLDPARAAALDRHVSRCPACAAFRAEQATLWNVLDEWQPEPVSSEFNRRLWQRIDSVADAPWYTRLADFWRFGSWKPAIPLAAAVLVVTTAFLMDHQGPAPVSPGGSGNGVSVMEVDQVERTLDDIQLLKQFDTTVAQAGDSTKTM